jgi:hypothetical protein
MEQKRVSKIRQTLIERGIRPPVYEWTEERRTRNGAKQRELIKTGAKQNLFVEKNPMSDPELRAKHLAAVKNNSKGARNSQYGTKWITNGSQNKKIKSVDLIPEGWYKGRS